MKETSPTVAALGRASRRVVYHMIQALVEGLKAIEAVIEEIGGIADHDDEDGSGTDRAQRIEVE